MWKLRVVAGALAVGGVLWGLFCLPFMVAGTLLAWACFGPGYLVTGAYIVRCFTTPPLGWRRAIWAASALVQGAWLLWALDGVRQGAWFSGFAFEFVTLGWWTFAFAVSVYGVIAEWATYGAEASTTTPPS
jgi:hypothetical protein